MPLSPLQTIAIICGVALGTIITRFTPFFLFPETKEPPQIVVYLGKMLPPAMMGLLVIYCLKNVSVFQAPYGAPEFLAIALIAILHKLKHNVLLSIGGGTAVYMILVQAVFV